jgi:catechol 2,3-dioxygenase-like lactoylglutathione lyase family enzyme
MKRLHVHVAVADLEDSVRFYRALFAAEPTVLKPDYAKWMLDDPRVNFAISTRGRQPGLDHLGIQVESDDELGELRNRLDEASLPAVAQDQAACCYARSNKHWTVDPQGLAWEAFHSLEAIPMFGGDDVPSAADAQASSCCVPAVESVKVAFPSTRRKA